MVTSTNADDFWRQEMESNRVLRRWWLQRLIKELENLGKRQDALRIAERWFGVTRAEDVQALLDAMPKPRTTTKRGKKGKLRRMLRDRDADPWVGHSVKRQDAVDGERPGGHLQPETGNDTSGDHRTDCSQ